MNSMCAGPGEQFTPLVKSFLPPLPHHSFISVATLNDPLATEKQTIQDNLQTTADCCAGLVPYLQKHHCCGSTVRLSFRRRWLRCCHPELAGEKNDPPPPHRDGRAEAASPQIVRGRGKHGLQRGADAVSRNTADILTGR